jgi:TatD DNase family protein
VSNQRPAIIDTHAHLDDDQFGAEVGLVIERAIAAGVRRIINIGYRPERWRTTLELADRFPEVTFTLGLHPHHVEEWSPTVEAELCRLLVDRKPVAIGEIGLDYFRNLNPAASQRRVFERQLELATKFGLPVVIHQRSAERDLCDVLRAAPPDLVCVLHSFDGTNELAKLAEERGYFIGVGGLMTRESSSELRNVLKSIPTELFLLETDTPYLVPVGVKYRRNEPANLTVIAERLAELVGMNVDQVIMLTTKNAERAFGPLLSAADSSPETRGPVR